MRYPTVHQTMFELVSDMNVAFGNPKGDPSHIMRDLEVHVAQCKNIGAEFLELMKAFGVHAGISLNSQYTSNDVDESHGTGGVDIDGVRDALCDIMVFALGAFHKMGVDADADMREVVSALYSRFCLGTAHLLDTQEHYDKLGVRYTVEGTFPTVCLKSAEDQQMPEYPKGKFLKAVGYRKPRFYELPFQELESAAEQMAKQRAQRMKEEAEWLVYRQDVVAKLQADLDAVPDDRRAKLLSGEHTVEVQVHVRSVA